MGQTALISASEMSRVSVVKELLLRGADHTTIDAVCAISVDSCCYAVCLMICIMQSGKSALAYANASENDALMELLVCHHCVCPPPLSSFIRCACRMMLVLLRCHCWTQCPACPSRMKIARS